MLKWKALLDKILNKLKDISRVVQDIKVSFNEKKSICFEQNFSDDIKMVYLNITLQADSELDFTLEQNSANSVSIIFLIVNLHTNSKFFLLNSAVGNSVNILFCKYNLLQSGATIIHESLQNAIFSGVSILSTKQNHLVASCKSYVEIKTLLSHNAKNLYFGNISIESMAIKSDAFQNHTTLMLNKDCKNSSVPSLCVKNNDVKCYHGSATSRLNNDFLYYLQSFGFDYNQASEFIIDGFFSDMYLRNYYDKARLKVFLEKFKQRLCRGYCG